MFLRDNQGMEIGLITTDCLGKLSEDIEFPYVSDDDLILVRELERRGHKIVSINWGAEIDGYSHLNFFLVRSPLDYILDREKFISWLEKLKIMGKKIINPFSIINWNSDKRYLSELSAAGFLVVPTIYVETNDTKSLLAHITGKNWTEIVIKRTISAGAHFMHRVAESEFSSFEEKFLEIRQEHPLMIQPFLNEITQTGEWSLIFFGTEFSHAVRKFAKVGDYRVQEQHGGYFQVERPPKEIITAAKKIIDSLPLELAYARVDGCVIRGEFVLIELELIEPELFFRTSANSAANCADILEKMVITNPA